MILKKIKIDFIFFIKQAFYSFGKKEKTPFIDDSKRHTLNVLKS